MYRNCITLLVGLMVITLSGQAHETDAMDMCLDNLWPCGLVLTPVDTPPLTALNCSDPVQVTYELLNIGSTSVMLNNLSLTPNDDNEVSDAVSLGCGPSCCNESVILAGGGGGASQCLVYLNFAPCSAGLLDYTLTITPDSTQRPLNWDINTVVSAGYNDAYVVNAGSNSISFCSLNEDGSFGSGSVDSSTCTSVAVLDITSTNLLNNPYAMTFDPTGEYLYVSNLGNNSVAVCPVEGPGELGTCTKNTDSTFVQPYGLTTSSTNDAGNVLYVSNRLANNISVCVINDDGSLAPCSTSPAGDDTLGLTPEDVAIINNGGLALITNNTTNNVSIMLVDDEGNLTFGENRNDPTLDQPSGIGFGGNNAYFTNQGNNTVAICNGMDCTSSADDANDMLTDPAGMFVAGSTAYFANLAVNGDSQYNIVTCPINGSDGTLIDASCTSLLDESFNMPSDVVLTP